jgi:hypothetical protein
VTLDLGGPLLNLGGEPTPGSGGSQFAPGETVTGRERVFNTTPYPMTLVGLLPPFTGGDSACGEVAPREGCDIRWSFVPASSGPFDSTIRATFSTICTDAQQVPCSGAAQEGPSTDRPVTVRWIALVGRTFGEVLPSDSGTDMVPDGPTSQSDTPGTSATPATTAE